MIIQRASSFQRALFTSFEKKVGPRYFTAPALTSAQPSTYRDYESRDIFDWDNLGFKLIQTDYMFMTKSSQNGNFEKGKLNPYGNIELSPSAGVLNYGQGLIEGTKAYRVDDGRIFLFRPQESGIRMQIGAKRMCMPSPSIQQFVDAVKLTTIANKRWIPPAGKGSLYIRPLLIGNGPILGIAPAPEYTFIIYACPVGNYLRNGTQPLTLYVEEEHHRASQGGAGGVKAITNYAPVIKAIQEAKERGYSDVLYLDSVNKKYIEEVSAANIFLVKGKNISTPIASGTILEGVTRKSIIDIAHDLGYKVEERLIEADELFSADEVFCTGTALGVAPVIVLYHSPKFNLNSNPNGIAIKTPRSHKRSPIPLEAVKVEHQPFQPPGIRINVQMPATNSNPVAAAPAAPPVSGVAAPQVSGVATPPVGGTAAPSVAGVAAPAPTTGAASVPNLIEETVRNCVSPIFKELLNNVANLNGSARGFGFGFGGIGMSPMGLGMSPMGLGFGGGAISMEMMRDEKWRKQQMLELEVYSKRLELVQDQVKAQLEELRSMGSNN